MGYTLLQIFIRKKIKKSLSSLGTIVDIVYEEDGACKIHIVPRKRANGLLLKEPNNLHLDIVLSDTLFIIPFFIFKLGVGEEKDFVRMMHSYPYCFFMDYRVPERNLDLLAYWIHYVFWNCRVKSKKKEKFQGIIKKNAIEGFIKRHQLNCIYRETAFWGAATIALIKSYCSASSCLTSAESGTTV